MEWGVGVVYDCLFFPLFVLSFVTWREMRVGDVFLLFLMNDMDGEESGL
jgi:hypothetical protein